ncbi:MAG TPA: hypothetical protein VGO91_11405 [Pyrinomonadaceae bacterium]|jgi:hypothetical protein|nr:hypothetical protein [Pyrinomonadaceae bacterium]
MVNKDKQKFKTTAGLLALWVGLLCGPLAWLLQLQVGYTLVPWACAHDVNAISLHLVTVVALLLTSLGGFISWRNWQRTGKKERDDEGEAVSRSRFMALLGLFTSAMFFLTILVQGIPSFILHPCQP